MNRISAIPAAAPAIPEKPNNAAISATTKNIKAHFNIVFSSIYLVVGGRDSVILYIVVLLCRVMLSSLRRYG